MLRLISASEVGAVTRHSEGAPTSTPLNVLLVEDDVPVGRAIAKSLRVQGHTVALAHTFADARNRTEHFDVGVFDLTLPDGDGIELCQLLLRDGRVGSALFCSGSIDDLLIERAQQTAPVISKEATFSELCQAIEAAAPATS